MRCSVDAGACHTQNRDNAVVLSQAAIACMPCVALQTAACRFSIRRISLTDCMQDLGCCVPSATANIRQAADAERVLGRECTSGQRTCLHHLKIGGRTTGAAPSQHEGVQAAGRCVRQLPDDVGTVRNGTRGLRGGTCALTHDPHSVSHAHNAAEAWRGVSDLMSHRSRVTESTTSRLGSVAGTMPCDLLSL